MAQILRKEEMGSLNFKGSLLLIGKRPEDAVRSKGCFLGRRQGPRSPEANEKILRSGLQVPNSGIHIPSMGDDTAPEKIKTCKGEQHLGMRRKNYQLGRQEASARKAKAGRRKQNLWKEENTKPNT
ncbi:hypothetical protein H6P81_020643 [Aristolochia fimbriata]|uniref:Uncharacterized protein n=1 Tax=Aristolochia fimbriata TaxID=158543 RepID=A0AAV7DZ96_ARIFI|nr:hypothetical protein H6P81_020643 [Aristolochia fimbriata]